MKEQMDGLIRALPRADQAVIDKVQDLISGLRDVLSAESLDGG
jgi:hypothetical protein